MSRRAVNRGEESTARQDGRAEKGGDTGGDDEAGCSPVHMKDDGDDPARRSEIRSKYRDLISTVQQNREDMLKPNDKLTEVLEEANKLFKEVHSVREALLDAKLLNLVADLGKEKASQLLAGESTFDPAALTENLRSFMGLNRLEDEEEEAEKDGATGGYLPADAWQK